MAETRPSAWWVGGGAGGGGGLRGGGGAGVAVMVVVVLLDLFRGPRLSRRMLLQSGGKHALQGFILVFAEVEALFARGGGGRSGPKLSSASIAQCTVRPSSKTVHSGWWRWTVDRVRAYARVLASVTTLSTKQRLNPEPQNLNPEPQNPKPLMNQPHRQRHRATGGVINHKDRLYEYFAMRTFGYTNISGYEVRTPQSSCLGKYVVHVSEPNH